MAFLNSTVFSNMMTVLANMVFTKVFNLQCCIPLSKQTHAHYYLPFLDILVHVIIVYNPLYVYFTLTFFNSIDILSSSLTY